MKFLKYNKYFYWQFLLIQFYKYKILINGQKFYNLNIILLLRKELIIKEFIFYLLSIYSYFSNREEYFLDNILQIYLLLLQKLIIIYLKQELIFFWIIVI